MGGLLVGGRQPRRRGRDPGDHRRRRVRALQRARRSGARSGRRWCLTGGLAQVVFLSVVRWPLPLRNQRAATAAAYRALAALAAASDEASTLPGGRGARRGRGEPGLAHAVRRRRRDDAAQPRQRGLPHARAADGDPRAAAPADAAGGDAAGGGDGPERRALRAHRGRAGHGRDWPSRATSTPSGRAAAPQRRARRRGPGLRRRRSRARPRCTWTAGWPRWPASSVPSPRWRRLRARAADCARAGALRADQPAAARLRDRPRADAGEHVDPLPGGPSRAAAGGHRAGWRQLIARELPLQRSYWMVVAAATVLRPEFGATFTRGAERALGTCLGVALAGAIAVTLPPGRRRHRRARRRAGVGGLLAVPGQLRGRVRLHHRAGRVPPERDQPGHAGDRHAPGCSTRSSAARSAWSPTRCGPPGRRTSAWQSLADLVGAERSLRGRRAHAAAEGRRPDDQRMRALARRARLARTTAESTVARSLSEPSTRRIDASQSQGALAAMRRLVQAAHVLRLDVQDERERRPHPGLRRFRRNRRGARGGADQPAGAPAAGADPPRAARHPRPLQAFQRDCGHDREALAAPGRARRDRRRRQRPGGGVGPGGADETESPPMPGRSGTTERFPNNSRHDHIPRLPSRPARRPGRHPGDDRRRRLAPADRGLVPARRGRAQALAQHLAAEDPQPPEAPAVQPARARSGEPYRYLEVRGSAEIEPDDDYAFAAEGGRQVRRPTSRCTTDPATAASW